MIPAMAFLLRCSFRKMAAGIAHSHGHQSFYERPGGSGYQLHARIEYEIIQGGACQAHQHKLSIRERLFHLPPPHEIKRRRAAQAIRLRMPANTKGGTSVTTSLVTVKELPQMSMTNMILMSPLGVLMEGEFQHTGFPVEW